MDWPVTESYCIAIAKAFGVQITFSWREHGFEGEMLRNGDPTGAVFIPDGEGHRRIGGTGPEGTRRKFPQVSADLGVRWCSTPVDLHCFLGMELVSNPMAEDLWRRLRLGEKPIMKRPGQAGFWHSLSEAPVEITVEDVLAIETLSGEALVVVNIDQVDYIVLKGSGLGNMRGQLLADLHHVTKIPVVCNVRRLFSTSARQALSRRIAQVLAKGSDIRS